MSERTGMSVSQVTDEVLYTGLVEMLELWGGGTQAPPIDTQSSQSHLCLDAQSDVPLVLMSLTTNQTYSITLKKLDKTPK